MNNEQKQWSMNLAVVRATMKKCSSELWALRPIMKKWNQWSQMVTATNILENVCFTIDALEDSINTEDE